jgi:hypothetical protein
MTSPAILKANPPSQEIKSIMAISSKMPICNSPPFIIVMFLNIRNEEILIVRGKLLIS